MRGALGLREGRGKIPALTGGAISAIFGRKRSKKSAPFAVAVRGSGSGIPALTGGVIERRPLPVGVTRDLTVAPREVTGKLVSAT